MKRFLGLLFILFLHNNAQAQTENPTETQPKVRVEMASNVSRMLDIYQERAKKYPQIDGYRIQIFNGRKDDCLESRGNFLKVHPDMPAYLLYEVPEYRTQVGDFRTRLEAEAFLRKIIQEFPGSFVLKTKIAYPK